MSATEIHNDSGDAAVGNIDMHLEIDVIPVSDVDRAKKFYQRLGWRLDDDVAPPDGLRIVQFTPPGSGASITFGTGLTTAAPGSAEGGITVSDIEAARSEVAGRGIDASDIWHGPPFPVEARQPGVDPDRASYGSFFSIADPDGNCGWSRRSPPGAPAGPTPPPRPSGPRRTWPARCAAPRRPTASTRSTRGGRTSSTGRSTWRTGLPGTPPTWWRSRQGRTCRPDRLNRLPVRDPRSRVPHRMPARMA